MAGVQPQHERGKVTGAHLVEFDDGDGSEARSRQNEDDNHLSYRDMDWSVGTYELNNNGVIIDANSHPRPYLAFVTK